MISAPHSYNISPIEILFGAIKSKKLNEDQLPTGKSNFKNVVDMLLKRVSAIPKSQRILYWH